MSPVPIPTAECIARLRVVVADKDYHERDFVEVMGGMGISAHVPRYKRSHACLVEPVLYGQPAYVASQKRRRRIERFFV